MPLRVFLISLLAVTYIGCLGRPSPPPKPDPRPGWTSVPPVEPAIPPGPPPATEEAPWAEIDDEVIALAWRGGSLAVLGGRSVSVFDERGQRLGGADLTDLVPARWRIPRRPVGRILPAGGDAWDLWSTAIAEGQVFRYRPGAGDPGSVNPVDVDPPGGPTIGIGMGWPGPVVEIAAPGEKVMFHLDTSGRLVAEPGRATSAMLIGEPLATARAAGSWVIYVSAPAVPGEPDRLLEYAWDGVGLRSRRASRAFEGRIAAVVPHAGEMVIAVVDRPRHTRLFLLGAEELWEEGAP